MTPRNLARLGSLAGAFLPSNASARTAAGASSIQNALMWIQDTILGNAATTVAVMAVAAVGFGMLTGRTNWRFGGNVIVGVFIVFGAGTIVAGIQSAAN